MDSLPAFTATRLQESLELLQWRDSAVAATAGWRAGK